ncbi:MAG: acyl dehydratase [Sulfitobacter sp.]|nr:acyl dehydratase [Sulfitobacter sp.]
MQTDQTDAPCQSDVMDPARACALQVALGGEPTLKAGDALPPFFHQLYFWEPAPPAALGRDGHPAVGGLIPDLGLPRRMWAAGRLAFERPLRLGVPATRLTHLDSVERKEGRSGPLGFVTLRHEVRQEGALCLTEWQHLVYREEADPNSPAPTPPRASGDAETVEDVTFDSTLLFRYSALTFNGHRIHYDLDHARDVEGYAGLVVHGPLLAQLLMLKARRELGPLKGFSFRATSALLHTETAQLCRKGRDLWVTGPGGRQCMIAEAAV